VDPWYKQMLIDSESGEKMNRLCEFVDLQNEHIHEIQRGFHGEHIRWKFPNGYGASVSVNQITHFVPELAVLKYDEENNVKLVYDTPITSDVIPGVDVGDTQSLLVKIMNLKGNI